MIHFPILRTRRLTVQLKELTIGQSIALASQPVALEQAETTAFLRACVETVEGNSLNPLDWTVQERMLGVCHYLASTSDDGPDFAVGDGGHYSDYFDGGKDFDGKNPVIPIGTVGDDEWSVTHLTGRDAEAIERLAGELKTPDGAPLGGKFHWILGAMAAQLRNAEDLKAEQHAKTDGELDEWLMRRMRIFAAFPERDFMELLVLYREGCAKIAHFFDIDFCESGIVAMPKGEAAKTLPPARFPVGACITAGARRLGGKAF